MRLQPEMTDRTELSSIQEGSTLNWQRSVLSSAAVTIRDCRACGALLLFSQDYVCKGTLLYGGAGGRQCCT